MKNNLKKILTALLLVWMQAGMEATCVNAQPGVAVSFSLFYNSLAPYGGWIQDPAYGYVWVPDVGPSFRPYYSGGHWVMTSYGNMWVSDYPWGWAPFHYGRWIYDGYYGWVWVPDNVWGPAWVSWRWGGGYAGWAPMGPGVSISMSFSNYYPPNDWWVFVQPTYLYNPVFYRYYEGPGVNATYIHRTTIVSNTYVSNGNTYIAGPTATQVENATNRRVAMYDVQDGSKPSQYGVTGKSVRVYRPEISESTANGRRVAPSKLMPAERSIGKMEPLGTEGGRAGQYDDAIQQERRSAEPQQQQRKAPDRVRVREPEMQQPNQQRNEERTAPSRNERKSAEPQRQQAPERKPEPGMKQSQPRQEERAAPARNERNRMQENKRSAPQEKPSPFPQRQSQAMPQQRPELKAPATPGPGVPRQQERINPNDKRMNMEQRRPQMQQPKQQQPTPQREKNK